MSMDQWTDKQLIDRWQNAKDQNAFRILDDRHRPHITRYVRRSLDGYRKDSADDIAQDVFTELLTTGQVFYDGRAVANWLVAVADRHVGMFFRSQGRKKRDASRTVELSTLLRGQRGRDGEHSERTACENVPKELISHENPDELACRNEMARLVRSLIDRLPGKQREVMLKMYVEHHTLGSAAEAMGISRNAASTHLARAKQALWAMHEIQQLADHSNSEPPLPREPAKTAGRSLLQNLPKIILILFAVSGEVADPCNLDVYCGVCTAENGDDEVSREDGGHHQADK